MIRFLAAAMCILAATVNANAAGCGYSYSSSYKQGYEYWPGGYFAGNSQYPAGSYSSGYYPSYSYQKKVVVEPVFYKYVAVVPLIEQPSYSAYYQTHPQAPAAPAAPAPVPAASADAGKLDRLLLLAEQTSGRLSQLETRMLAVESKVGGPAASTPVPNPRPPASIVDVPTLLYAKCAACHESKVASKLGGRFTFFVNDMATGAQMAALGTDGKPALLPAASLKKIEKALADGTMPPAQDKDGKSVANLSVDERRTALEFIRRAVGTAR